MNTLNTVTLINNLQYMLILLVNLLPHAICLVYMQVHTWINPYCSVALLNGEKVKARAFAKEGTHLLGPEISNMVCECILQT